MARVLVVCTGNVCRSPIAEGLLRAALEVRVGDQAPSVASAGTMGWEGSGADPGSVKAAAERGVDISAHRARELRPEEAVGADLVLGMAGEHVDALSTLAPGKTFTLKELVRLLEALPAPSGPGAPPGVLAARVAEADTLRRSGFEGNALDEDIADPLGMPLESFRAIAWELEEWCGRLADGLFGRHPARMGSEVD
jgi:protein-tyrosine phosphatase